MPPRHAAPGEVVESLVALRAWAGSPSFTEIARRVTAARTSRGVPVVEARLARSTAYDCFRHGRRRIDVDLVLEIVRALGVAETDARRWRAALTTPPGRTGGVGVEVRRGLPRTESLVGRDEEVERAVMADGATLITGMAGVGKTALALAVAKRLVDSAAVDDVLVARLDGHAQSDDPAALDALLGLLAEEIGELDGAPRSAEPAGRRARPSEVRRPARRSPRRGGRAGRPARLGRRTARDRRAGRRGRRRRRPSRRAASPPPGRGPSCPHRPCR